MLVKIEIYALRGHLRDLCCLQNV